LGESKSKKRRFLEEHRHCCFCGGQEPSTTIDHVPAKAHFPDGFAPEGFEFPACDSCNRGSKRDDQIAGFYTQIADFGDTSRTPEAEAKIRKLTNGIRENYPEALPNHDDGVPINQIGSLYTPTPVAVSFEVPAAYRPAMMRLQQKLTHALYYRETGSPITEAHHYGGGFYQIQNHPTTLTDYFKSILPQQFIGGRPNIKQDRYGQRFAFMSGYKDEDFFVYAAQFGIGMIFWGMVLGPAVFKTAQPSEVPLHRGGTIGQITDEDRRP